MMKNNYSEYIFEVDVKYPHLFEGRGYNITISVYFSKKRVNK